MAPDQGVGQLSLDPPCGLVDREERVEQQPRIGGVVASSSAPGRIGLRDLGGEVEQLVAGDEGLEPLERADADLGGQVSTSVQVQSMNRAVRSRLRIPSRRATSSIRPVSSRI